ncbi:MAG: tRNA (adenosine(37)-N6)-threonylcarbamoyltransferase complex ATPase subunit type 1 TsaE [Armatimonadetes bacterium]|nr:tRNA (adenosine(37)-N6)-threonylcarbamoyltransferase complex ATPase subunit type 1 TsaE [Armatimonadota bacterium]
MTEKRTFAVADEAAMIQLGRELADLWKAGDCILLSGELGAGKTTLVRGILAELGWTKAVRSPTFTILQTYETEPPVLHADLYRLESADDTGLEEYWHDHLCLIEWPDRLDERVTSHAWRVEIAFEEPGRVVTVTPPALD